MGRTILGVVAGVVVAWLTITASQFASAAMFPPPPGLDLRDPGQLAAFIAAVPPVAMALVVIGWTLGAFAGAAVAARISRKHALAAALLVAALVVAGVIANSTLIPHPLWMTVLGVALPLPAAWWAARLAAKPRPA